MLHILMGAAMQQINTLAPPDRIGEADPPSLIFWFNLYQVARNRGGISHFLAPCRGSHAHRGLHCGSVLGLFLQEPAPHRQTSRMPILIVEPIGCLGRVVQRRGLLNARLQGRSVMGNCEQTIYRDLPWDIADHSSIACRKVFACRHMHRLHNMQSLQELRSARRNVQHLQVIAELPM